MGERKRRTGRKRETQPVASPKAALQDAPGRDFGQHADVQQSVAQAGVLEKLEAAAVEPPVAHEDQLARRMSAA